MVASIACLVRPGHPGCRGGLLSWRAGGSKRSCQSVWDLDSAVGGFDGGACEHARLQAEFTGGLAAQGVIADAQQAGSLIDPERRHLATLTQMRLQALMAAAFTAANSYMQAKMSNSNKPHPFRSIPERVVAALINRTRLD